MSFITEYSLNDTDSNFWEPIYNIKNKFIIAELLPCVRQFCDQFKGLLHEQVSVSLNKWEALCILVQYEIELIHLE